MVAVAHSLKGLCGRAWSRPVRQCHDAVRAKVQIRRPLSCKHQVVTSSEIVGQAVPQSAQHLQSLTQTWLLQGTTQATSVLHEDMRSSPSLTSSADLSSVLALENIRQTLIRQEDTIIFLLIERAQFARNAAVYQTDVISVPDALTNGHQQSLLEYLLRETEHVHGKIRRYTSPDEQAFYPDSIPNIILPPIAYAEVCSQSSFAVLPFELRPCVIGRV